MDIVIHDTQAFKHYLEEKNTLWEIYHKRILRFTILQYIIGLILVAIGFALFRLNSNGKISEDQHSFPGFQYLMNIMVNMPIAYILFLTLGFINLRKPRSKLMDDASRFGKIVFSRVNESTVTISEESIQFKNPVSTVEMKWAAFSSYALIKGNLILTVSEIGMNS
jgi:hypothetical protein